MYCLRAPLTPEIVESLETHLAETGSLDWSVHYDALQSSYTLQGYFQDRNAGEAQYEALTHGPWGLPPIAQCIILEDKDWREAYKAHFPPLRLGALHWIPIWDKETTPIASHSIAVYLDPGMAFGTGHHETTRLCARGLLEAWAAWEKELSRKSVVDVGCGSGILAISAAQLGFGYVSAFDNDEEAIRICQENAAFNPEGARIRFNVADIRKGLARKHADLILANIQADVLLENRSYLCRAVAPGGILLLSGILQSEILEVENEFLDLASIIWGAVHSRITREGEWAAVTLWREL